MYKFFVKLGAYFLLMLSLILFVPFYIGRIRLNIGRISLKKFREYLSDVSYKADEIIEGWGSSDER